MRVWRDDGPRPAAAAADWLDSDDLALPAQSGAAAGATGATGAVGAGGARGP